MNRSIASYSLNGFSNVADEAAAFHLLDVNLIDLVDLVVIYVLLLETARQTRLECINFV